MRKLLIIILMTMLLVESKGVFSQLYGRYDYISVPLSEATEKDRHFHLSITLLSESNYIMRVGQIDECHSMQEFSVGTFDVLYDTLRLTEAENSYQMKYLVCGDSLLPIHTFSGLTNIVLTSDADNYRGFRDVYDYNYKRIRHPLIFHFGSPIPIKIKGEFGHVGFHRLILKEDHTYTLEWRGYLISEGTWKRRLNRVFLSDSVLHSSIKCVIRGRKTVRLIIPYYHNLVLFDDIEEGAEVTVEKLSNVR